MFQQTHWTRACAQCLRMGLAIGLLASFGCAHAQTNAATYPQKPIKILVGFSPGGVPDIVARVLAPKFTDTWKQAVVVENKLGAGSNVAAQAAATSAPDGYTLLSISSAHAISPAIYSKLAYDAAAVLAMSSEPFERGQEETRAEVTVAFCREAATVEDNTVTLLMNGATGQFREVDAATTGPRLAPLDREIIKVVRQREAELNVGAAVTREAIRSTLGKARESVNDAIDRLVGLRILAEKPGRAVALVGEVR